MGTQLHGGPKELKSTLAFIDTEGARGRPSSGSSDEVGRALLMFARAAGAARALLATRAVEGGPR